MIISEYFANDDELIQCINAKSTPTADSTLYDYQEEIELDKAAIQRFHELIEIVNEDVALTKQAAIDNFSRFKCGDVVRFRGFSSFWRVSKVEIDDDLSFNTSSHRYVCESINNLLTQITISGNDDGLELVAQPPAVSEPDNVLIREREQ